jgi:3-hydroxyisobutyrate dehydrogenase-like beta-hydroxyacid dehydrogenase
MLKVGVVGVGRLGAAMALRLANCAIEVHVYDAQAVPVELQAHPGIVVATDLEAVVRASSHLLVIVSTDSQVRDVVAEVSEYALTPGLPVGIVSTVRPATIHRAREAAPQLDIMDLPVSGGPHGALAGSLTLMAGGDFQSTAVWEPVFAALSDSVYRFGSPGDGAAVKLATQALMHCQVWLLCQAADAMSLRGIDREQFLAAVQLTSAASWASENIGLAADRHFTDLIDKDFASFLATVGDVPLADTMEVFARLPPPWSRPPAT